MLTVNVSGEEFFDEDKAEFISTEVLTLKLEHSLVSLSKWESKFRKPFLGPVQKSSEEIYGYVEAMIISGDFSPEVYSQMSKENLDAISDYMASQQSATTFVEPPGQKARGRSEVITSELIYFWMVSYNVPFECETWHLNRLFALLRICNIKTSNEKKMSPNEVAAQQRTLNAQRRAELGTKG